MPNGLHAIDWVIIIAYAMGMIALGWHYSQRQQSTDEYFSGGGTMSPVLIGISLFATLMSTISYLSSPGELIQNGPLMLCGALSIPICYVIVGYGLIPAFMKYRVTSAYELLEMKLGLSTRLLGAAMFVALRLMWMAVLLNFAANALLVMVGWDQNWLLPVTAIVGSVALIYSSMGGLRAVVVTDMAQFILLFGGSLLVIFVISQRMDGWSWIPQSWDEGWKPQPIFSFDPFVRLTVVGVVVMQGLWTICTAGGDQTAIQRFMATKDAAAARRSYLVNSLAALMVVAVLAAVGASLLSYFRAFPDQLPSGRSLADSADDLFPYFIAHHLPVGISGLVVSGLFAAAMSSVDSGVNSISAVTLTDFVDRFRGQPMSPRAHVAAAKAIVVVVGVIVIAGSMLIEQVPGNLLIVSKRVTGLLITPLFTLFFMALFVRFATATGTNVGALCGLVAAVLVSFWSPLVGERPISVTWINAVGLLTSVTVGCLVSWFDT